MSALVAGCAAPGPRFASGGAAESWAQSPPSGHVLQMEPAPAPPVVRDIDGVRYLPEALAVGELAAEGGLHAGLPVIPQPIAELDVKPAAVRHVVRPGDTLMAIARQHLGDAARWRDLAQANPGLNPDHLPIGTVVWIP